MANRPAQLSVAELLARDVRLSASEAVALTLAVAGSCGTVQASDADILLDSTGRVVCANGLVQPSGEESTRLAALLQRLLRVEGVDASERRGRIPGGLLVVLARVLRQIDLPPLSRDAFCDALSRFATPEPALLAAVFWRAARMRPRSGRRGEIRASRAKAERRARGPSAAELRRWLRQTDRELFRLRQSRQSFVTSAVVVALVGVVLLGIGATFGDASRVDGPTAPEPGFSRQSAHTAIAVSPVVLPQLSSPTSGSPRRRAASVAESHARPAKQVNLFRPATRTAGRSPRRTTVSMVNLPRSTWAVVRHLDSDSPR